MMIPPTHSVFKLSSGAKHIFVSTFLIYVLMIDIIFENAAVQDVCIQ